MPALGMPTCTPSAITGSRPMGVNSVVPMANAPVASASRAAVDFKDLLRSMFGEGQCGGLIFANEALYAPNSFALESTMKTTLDELQAFVAVVDTGTITAASESLGLTVSATSRTLARLEGKLQTSLLRRTTRRLELTEEGAVFLQHARAILASVDTVEEQMAARRMHPAGRLRVDAATPFMLHVLVPLLEGFRARYPDVELELNSNE